MVHRCAVKRWKAENREHHLKYRRKEYINKKIKFDKIRKKLFLFKFFRGDFDLKKRYYLYIYMSNQKNVVILLRKYRTIKLLCQQHIKITLIRYQRYIKEEK